MVGFYGGDPVGSIGERAAGTDIIPAPAGDVNAARFSEALADNLGNRLFRDTMDTPVMGAGGDPMLGAGDASLNYGTPASGYSEPQDLMQPSEAQAKYPGIKVTQPVSERLAQALYEAHHAEELRQDIIARSDGSLLASAPVGFAVSLAAGLLDPVNVAAGLVPIVGEARVASMLARASGALGRAGVRAGVGAAEGAVGMAALEPVNYALDRFEGNDWTMGEAIRNIAMGAVFGTVLHVGGGFIKDTVTGRRMRADSPTGELLRRLDALDPETREAAFRGSVAAVAEGRPVGVASLLDFAEARTAERELAGWAERQQRMIAEAEEAARVARGAEAPDRSAAIAEADAHLARLRSEMEGFRSDIEAARGRAITSAMDPETSARLDAINAELRTVIPRARREDLQRELAMLMEGRGTLDVRASADVDAARGAAEVQGLQAGLARTEAAAAEAEATLAKLKETAAAEEAAAQARRVSADRAERIRQARDDGREAVLQSLAERTLRRFAAQVGTALEPGEARLLAKEIRNAQPGEAADTIANALNSITNRSGLPDIQAIADAGPRFSGVERLRAEATGAANELHAGAEPHVSQADITAAQANAETLARAPKVDGPLDAQAAELKALYDQTRGLVEAEVAAGRLTEGDVAMLKAADERAKNLEGDAKAAEAAAACMVTRA